MNPNRFPLPFPYTRIHRQDTDRIAEAPFLVAAMFTEGYTEYADRLARSCESRGLQYALYEVPAVHRSISPKGSTDPAFTKANFIRFLQETHRKPVLYLDADCVIADEPDLIEKLVREGRDFAIFNWLAEEHTESYVPVRVNLRIGDGIQTFTDRFYRFSHSIDNYAVDQLVCSGAVQFYNESAAARNLLRNWHETILRFPQSADDQCLDFIYNNRPPDLAALKETWLGKAYIRCAWWIYERPVIDHPEFPLAGNNFRQIRDSSGARQYYPERTELKAVEYYFPRDCLIDTEKRVLMRVRNGQLIPWTPVTRTLWL